MTSGVVCDGDVFLFGISGSQDPSGAITHVVYLWVGGQWAEVLQSFIDNFSRSTHLREFYFLETCGVNQVRRAQIYNILVYSLSTQ